MMLTTTQGDKFLVRIYHSNKDKQNIWFDSLQESLESLGVTESDIVSSNEWLGFVDYSIRGTKNYIRKVKKVLVD